MIKPILVIDTATRTTAVHLLKTQGTFSMVSQGQKRAEDLLAQIDQLCKTSRVTLAQLAGIVVRDGIGSYTGLRIGVTIANTLAWSLNIPVVGLTSRKLGSLQSREIDRQRQKIFSRVKQALKTPSRPVVPKYGQWSARFGSATI